MVPGSLATVSNDSFPSFDEGAFLEECEPEARRRAAKSASKARLDPSEIDDLTQEILLALFRAARKKGNALDENHVRRLTTKVLQSEWRKAQRVRGHEVSLETLDDRPDEKPLGPDPLVSNRIGRKVDVLPTRLKRVFDGIYREDLTQRQVATRLGISQPRVAKLHKALLDRCRDDLSEIAAA